MSESTSRTTPMLTDEPACDAGVGHLRVCGDDRGCSEQAGRGCGTARQESENGGDEMDQLVAAPAAGTTADATQDVAA
eukprot:2669797-Rhodomonas_salina.2